MTKWIVGLLAMLTVIVTIGIYAIIKSLQPAPPVIDLQQTAYPAARTEYRAGDTVIFTSTVTITKPGVPTATRGWRIRGGRWSQARDCAGKPIPPTQSAPQPAYPAEAVGAKITTVLTTTVPLMPPNDYVFTNDISGSVYSVNVRVVGAC